MKRLLLLTLAASMPLATASAQNKPSVQSAVDKSLERSAFRDVHGTVLNGVVTLTGTVNLYQSRLDAEVNVSQIHGVRYIQDNIQVIGPIVSDAVLQSRLQRQVHTRAISVEVHKGIARLDGVAIDPLVAWAAVSKTAKTPGVQGIVDDMTVSNRPPGDLGPMPYTISSVP